MGSTAIANSAIPQSNYPITRSPDYQITQLPDYPITRFPRVMYTDLTDFLSDLDRRRLLARVSEPVSPDLEIAAVTDRACKAEGGGPALLFEKPGGFDVPVAINVFGSLERMC